MLNIIFANEFQRDSSQPFIFVIGNFFSKMENFAAITFRRIYTSKNSYLLELGNMTFAVFILLPVLQNLPAKYSCQQHFSRTSTLWFSLMLLLCFIHTIEYKPERSHWSSVLWRIPGLLFSIISYFRPIFTESSTFLFKTSYFRPIFA